MGLLRCTLMRRSTVVILGGFVCAAAVTTSEAEAHFRLEAPAAMTEQNQLGDPQKTYPCGGPDGTAMTGEVTAYTAGDTVTISINEEIYHPGHYRVSLATDDMSQLPPDPPITPSAQDECAMTEIMSPPVFPVIADGMLPHSEPFDGMQTFEVTIPQDVSCDDCTLQVVQYMSDHAAPCFYYHCANISVAALEGGDTSGGPDETTGSATTGSPGTTTGDPDSTGSPGETSAGNSETGQSPDPGSDDDTGAPASGSGSGIEPESSGDSGGCRVDGHGPAGLLGLLPVLLVLRRRRS